MFRLLPLLTLFVADTGFAVEKPLRVGAGLTQRLGD
jgi:hypothetical protein